MRFTLKFGIVLLTIYNLFYLSSSAKDISDKIKEDTVPIYSDSLIKKSIYLPDSHKRSGIYNRIVGKHYRELYSTPISVKSTRLYDLYGGLKFVGQLPRLHALFLEDKEGHQYLVRPLGGATTFIESDFFKNTYNREDFKDTYLDKFIGDAYTITHPYAFLVANKLAEGVGLSSFDSEIFYIPENATTDTIADGTGIADRLVSIYDLKTFTTQSKVIETDNLLTKIQESKSFHVNQHEYIRERLLDILIGDWNKTKENWQWYGIPQSDSIVYMPLVADRSHTFTRVDGILFKLMLNVFGLNSITNYDGNYNNLKKANGIGIPLDVALVARSGREVWEEEAKYLGYLLTDSVIDSAFKELPEEIYETNSTETIKANLKKRRDAIEDIAHKYYNILQETPVITGTNGNDLFVIEQSNRNTTNICIYDRNTNALLFDKEYDKNTKEIWLYGLSGDDIFRISGKSRSGTPLTLVGGKGTNIYNIERSRNTTIYDYKNHNVVNDTLGDANIIRTNVEKVHTYDYTKLKYHTVNFTPWGVYDSDLGFYLGAYLSKTMYGFKRSPYSYRHRIGFSYLDGLMYQGFFPSLDEKNGFSIEAIFGVANDFHNFFGYGNQTNGHRDAEIEYNRVDIGRYSIQPSYYWRLSPMYKITAQSTLEVYTLSEPTDRFINQVYGDNSKVFDTKVFADVNLTYDIHKEIDATIPAIDLSVTSGLTWNLSDLRRNFPYLRSKLSVEINCTDRFSIATAFIGEALFTNRYEFYQAASVELRGFRDNRFIGRQSFYQHTDFRYDLGRLKNPFTPINYGVFTGFDHGRVWLPNEHSRTWHISYGGGFWLTLLKKYTGKFSYFSSDDGNRFYIGIGLGL
ncbi:hypothetical protein [Dysgonomonas sp. ZJ279]|uniref:hypothetical protein n=1 Tax=Dysgonomonas sp. ZJ279 TaxID=2709796 RepID=UPI0013EAD960|nr:hypothetical protein [Dysgonomonas sp. ZJ279]